MSNVLKEVFQVGVPYLIRALTPLHPGSGSRVSGLVDLPVQREAGTDLPVIYGSSLKGALRSWATLKGLDEREIEEIFGPPPGAGDKGMGKAVFMDAKLLFMPVRSLKGIFAWITSPFLLKRFERDMDVVKKLSGKEINVDIGEIDVKENEALLTSGNKLAINLKGRNVVVLEDIVLDIRIGGKELSFLAELKPIYEELVKRLAILSDDTFRRLLNRAMEIVPHIAIGDKGVVENLWYQENLPAETIMYSVVFTSSNNEKKLSQLLKGTLHVGGDITTGLGIVEIQRLGVV